MVIPELFRTCSYLPLEGKISCTGLKRQGCINSDQRLGSSSCPRFHAYYQEHVTVYGIEPVEMLTGALPKRQQRLVEAWAEYTARTDGRLGSPANRPQTFDDCTVGVERS